MIVAIMLWRALRRPGPRLGDIVLYGVLGVVSLWIVIDPAIGDRFLEPGVGAVPLGRLVVLLLCAQLVWLVMVLVLTSYCRRCRSRDPGSVSGPGARSITSTTISAPRHASSSPPTYG